MKRALVLATVLAATSAEACSGPDVMGTIEAHQRFATVCACAIGLLFLVALRLTISRRLDTGTFWNLAGMFALHPAWTISGFDGDCGFMQVNASILFLGIAALLTWFLFLAWFRAGTTTARRATSPSEQN
ncbi:hypothetical protein [Fimbriimonas ginsengisoli]|uniref:Lipoprotein n=1 Tax=Fimbriimonas ginsengisoli Gsoil 348 TaxID=661478 RepID=A0A068NL13_FIMGI|nr:hypothetical protein [Fimbriimonas ginsengisoli]AIE84097.1 hypothetical protein OP10G_0729 [Fimbriimonas ginsengisoli Gsoil 348]